MKWIQPLYYEGMILLDKNLMYKNFTPLALLKKRAEQNYADFKAEMLIGDEEYIYEMAHRIAAVKDTYEQIINDSEYLDDGDAKILLRFHNLLEMVADYLQEVQAERPVDINDAFIELYGTENLEESYITMNFAEELRGKYGDDVRIKIALLLETIEAGERYLQLMKLTDLPDMDDFSESGFFIFEDDEEGCF